MIRKLIIKLLILLLVVGAWLFYFNPAMMSRINPASIRQMTEGIGSTISTDLPSVEIPTTTRVYQWRDTDGKLHVSDQPPTDGSVAEEKLYRSDLNVVPATKSSEAREPAAKNSATSDPAGPETHASGNDGKTGSDSSGPLDAYKDLIKETHRTREALEQRQQNQADVINQ
ncbi:MAG: DUF4124 domain-containing protein [Gammaproteobacteria bacterium]|nr:DUF4124 domain-containing protein [Gammaproteobacteria bacterium]